MISVMFVLIGHLPAAASTVSVYYIQVRFSPSLPRTTSLCNTLSPDSLYLHPRPALKTDAELGLSLLNWLLTLEHIYD